MNGQPLMALTAHRTGTTLCASSSNTEDHQPDDQGRYTYAISQEPTPPSQDARQQLPLPSLEQDLLDIKTLLQRQQAQPPPPAQPQFHLEDLQRAVRDLQLQNQQVYKYDAQTTQQDIYPGTPEARRVSQELEQHEFFNPRTSGNITRKLNATRSSQLNPQLPAVKQPSTPAGLPLPYKRIGNQIQLTTTKFTGPLFRSTTGKQHHFTTALLQWAQHNCYRCGEHFCGENDSRCIYHNTEDTWFFCGTCHSGFHLSKNCQTINNSPN